MTLRIASLVARHGSTKYASALQELDGFYRRQMPGVERELVVIDNALPEAHRERLGAAQTLIGGSNETWEFSAWDAGLGFLGERLLGFDFVHLVTSAYGELYSGYLSLLDASMLAALQGRACALGHIDFYNEPVALLGRVSQSWLRTSFIFLPPAELRLLGSLVSVADRSALFSGDPTRPFAPDAPLSAGFQGNIRDWLTGAGTGQGVTWHSRFDLTGATLSLFEAKALAIINEHALTVRLRAQGCAIVDATWLAAQRDTWLPAGRWVGALPHWRDQLAARLGPS